MTATAPWWMAEGTPLRWTCACGKTNHYGGGNCTGPTCHAARPEPQPAPAPVETVACRKCSAPTPDNEATMLAGGFCTRCYERRMTCRKCGADNPTPIFTDLCPTHERERQDADAGFEDREADEADARFARREFERETGGAPWHSV